MTALWSHITNETSLLSLCHAHQLSGAVFAGLELGLFEYLSHRSGATVEEAAGSLEIPTDNLKRLVRQLLAMGLLEGTEERIWNSPLTAKSLVLASSENCVSVLLHQGRNVYPAYGNLVDVLQTARTAAQASDYALYDHLDEREYAVYLGAANFYSRGIGTALSESIDFSSVKHVVDLGSGGGQVAQELMEALPHISMTLVDRSEALTCLSGRPDIQKFHGRFSCVEGDFLRPLSIESKKADVVILSSVLGDWEERDRSKILANARSILKPGGYLLITETLLSEDGLGALRAGVISLYVLLLTKGGNNHTASFWQKELEENGFEVEGVRRNGDKGMRDIIVAKKRIS